MTHEERARKWLAEMVPGDWKPGTLDSLAAQFAEVTLEATERALLNTDISALPQYKEMQARITQLEAERDLFRDANRSLLLKNDGLEASLEAAEQKCTNNPSGRNSCVSRSGDDTDWCDGCKRWSAARAKVGKP